MSKDIDNKIRELVQEGFTHCELPPNAKRVLIDNHCRELIAWYDNLMDIRLLDREKYKDLLSESRSNAHSHLDSRFKIGLNRKNEGVCKNRADLLFIRWLQDSEGVSNTKQMKWLGKDAKQLARLFVMLEKAKWIDRAQQSAIYEAFDMSATYDSFGQYVRNLRHELPVIKSPRTLDRDNGSEIFIGPNKDSTN